MILQSLNQLYERLAEDERYGLPTPGYSSQQITFRIVLHPDGRLHAIEDARDTLTDTTRTGATRTRQVPKKMLLPGNAKPPGQGINPCILWDNSAYLLGYKKDDTKPERSALCAAASRDQHLALKNQINDPAFNAVCRFLQSWTMNDASVWKNQLDDFAATGFGVFQILGSNQFVHQTPAFRQWWASRSEPTAHAMVLAPCLVTGEVAPIARLAEPAIKGVNGAAPGGAKLASFNLNAFESYGKEQTYNAPVSEHATFQYCNALNALLSGPQCHRHRIVIGDATTVFWTERETTTESLFAKFLGGEINSLVNDQDPLLHSKLTTFLSILRKGGRASIDELRDDPTTKFFILGLSGNVTRLSVRFWHVSSISQMLDRLTAHFEALRIKPSVIQILNSLRCGHCSAKPGGNQRTFLRFSVVSSCRPSSMELHIPMRFTMLSSTGFALTAKLVILELLSSKPFSHDCPTPTTTYP